MGKSESQLLTFTGQGKATKLAEVQIIGIPMPSLIVEPVEAPSLKKRVKQPWVPTDREQAILNIPRKMPLAEYCRALDLAGILFPEKWQRQGKPTLYADAWESKSKKLRSWVKSDRYNVWARFLKA